MGSEFISTEENSFVWDALKLGADIKAFPLEPVTHKGFSTGHIWTDILWESKGAFFARNFGKWGMFAGIFFILKKTNVNNISTWQTIRHFFSGYQKFRTKQIS